MKTDDENGCHHRRSRWVRAVEHREGRGYVEVTFTQGVSPYTALLRQRPTTYLAKEAAQTILIDAIRVF